MRNKGFTLIELLAVIVILAIIALIATPIILGIINDSRKSAAEETAKLISKTFETAHAAAYMVNGGKQPTLYEVCSRFQMDNAKCEPGEYNQSTSAHSIVITADIESIECEVTSVPSVADANTIDFTTTKMTCYTLKENGQHDEKIVESPTVTVRKMVAPTN